MRTIALAVIIAACSQPDSTPPSKPDQGDYMGLLPVARTVTLGPDDPIPSALLNELQDQIIGYEISLWAPSFRGDSLALGTLSTNVYGLSLNTFGAVGNAYATIPAPVGLQLLDVLYWYDVNGTATALTMDVKYYDPLTAAVTSVASGTDNNGVGLESKLVAASAGAGHVILPDVFYHVVFGIGHVNHRIHGARLRFGAL